MSLPGYPADWPAPPGVKTWQTVRAGGVSTGARASLNLGVHVGDDPRAVADNRSRLRAGLDLPSEPVWLEQVHGHRILRVDPVGPADQTDSVDQVDSADQTDSVDERGGGTAGGPASADGAITARPGVVLAVMTADCLPVLLARRDGAEVAVAHAGWRGLAAGVLEAAIAAFDCAPDELLAWLGPAIGPDAFEVGDEVRAAFADRDAEAAMHFVPNARGRWQADLDALARRRLLAAGLKAIHGRPECTFADAGRFFSHRREAPCGRMASLIWIA